MADTLIHVRGLDVLDKMLATLPQKLERNIMRGAMRAAAKPIQEQAKRTVQKVSGETARGLKVFTSARTGIVKSYVRATGLHFSVAHWLEYSTKGHWIKVPEAEKPINWQRGRNFGRRVSMRTINRIHHSLKIGLRFIGPTVWHPGARAYPFLRPALDGQGQAAVLAAADYIKARLTAETGIDLSGVLIEGDE